MGFLIWEEADMDDELQKQRNKIDKIDEELINLLLSRIKLADRIGSIKKQFGIPVTDPEREKYVLSKTHGVNLEYRQQVQRIFRQIIRECSLVQENSREGR